MIVCTGSEGCTHVLTSSSFLDIPPQHSIYSAVWMASLFSRSRGLSRLESLLNAIAQLPTHNSAIFTGYMVNWEVGTCHKDKIDTSMPSELHIHSCSTLK